MLDENTIHIVTKRKTYHTKGFMIKGHFVEFKPLDYKGALLISHTKIEHIHLPEKSDIVVPKPNWLKNAV